MSELDRFKERIDQIADSLIAKTREERIKILERELQDLSPEEISLYRSIVTVEVLRRESDVRDEVGDTNTSMKWERIATYVTAVAFILIMLGIAIFIPKPTEPQSFTFRIVLALMAGAFGAFIPGFLEIKGKIAGFALRATGAIGLTILVYLVNPPAIVEKPSPPQTEAGNATVTPSATLTAAPSATATAPKYTSTDHIIVSDGQEFTFELKNIKGDKDNFSGSRAGMTGEAHYEIATDPAGQVEVALVGKARAEEVTRDWQPSGDNSTWDGSFRKVLRTFPAGSRVKPVKLSLEILDTIRVNDDPGDYVKAYEHGQNGVSSNGVISRWEFQLRTGKLVVKAAEFIVEVETPTGN